MGLTADFTWPAIFAVSIRTQLYGYFYCEDKNAAMLLTLQYWLCCYKNLVPWEGYSSTTFRKDNRDSSLLVQQFDLTPPSNKKKQNKKQIIVITKKKKKLQKDFAKVTCDFKSTCQTCNYRWD